MQTDADKKNITWLALPLFHVHNGRLRRQKKKIKCEAAECHKLDKENWERPDDFSSAFGGKHDLLKGQSEISEKSHFHLSES